MTRGDRVDISGYDIQAEINYASSDWSLVVCHNNSSHILLFKVPPADDPECLDFGHAVFLQSWKYWHIPESEYSYLYEQALGTAVLIAVGKMSDE